jgi:hypothetical protein
MATCCHRYAAEVTKRIPLFSSNENAPQRSLEGCSSHSLLFQFRGQDFCCSHHNGRSLDKRDSQTLWYKIADRLGWIEIVRIRPIQTNMLDQSLIQWTTGEYVKVTLLRTRPMRLDSRPT